MWNKEVELLRNENLVLEAAGNRRCFGCRTVKVLMRDFAKKSSARHGRASHCKVCLAAAKLAKKRNSRCARGARWLRQAELKKMGLKQCGGRCGAVKAIADFGPLRPQCRECHNAEERAGRDGQEAIRRRELKELRKNGLFKCCDCRLTLPILRAATSGLCRDCSSERVAVSRVRLSSPERAAVINEQRTLRRRRNEATNLTVGIQQLTQLFNEKKAS